MGSDSGARSADTGDGGRGGGYPVRVLGGEAGMVVTAAFRLSSRPEQLGALGSAVRGSFGAVRDLRLGRQRARLFQRLGYALDLLSVEEWEDQERIEGYLRSPRYAEVVAACEEPPIVRYYVPLRSFELILQPVAIAACASIIAPVQVREAVEAHLRGDAYEAIVGAPGVRFLQVNRDLANPNVFLVLHGWAALEDLERFRREVSPALGTVLSDLGASLERFTGAVVADTDHDT